MSDPDTEVAPPGPSPNWNIRDLSVRTMEGMGSILVGHADIADRMMKDLEARLTELEARIG